MSEITNLTELLISMADRIADLESKVGHLDSRTVGMMPIGCAWDDDQSMFDRVRESEQRVIELEKKLEWYQLINSVASRMALDDSAVTNIIHVQNQLDAAKAIMREAQEDISAWEDYNNEAFSALLKSV